MPKWYMTDSVRYIGETLLTWCQSVGDFFIFFYQCICPQSLRTVKSKRILRSLYQIGVESVPIVSLTGTTVGLVFALQSYIGFQRVGGEQLIGAVVTIGLARELGPILTGLMVTGRAGSSIAAEIATMRVTEQIDALETLCINPLSYLVIPRLIAGAVILPCLTLICVVCGILGGYLTYAHILGLNGESYFKSIYYLVEFRDITSGLIKSTMFGLILTLVGTYKGFSASGGAREVGKATTQAVVLSSILIILSDYFLTKCLERL